jgi:hypothetical protein
MIGGNVLVRARFDGQTIPAEKDEEIYEFQAGDIGLLTWGCHAYEDCLWVSKVKWSADPLQKSRKILLGSVIAIGFVR